MVACPHCGASLYGNVSRCYRCHRFVSVADPANVVLSPRVHNRGFRQLMRWLTAAMALILVMVAFFVIVALPVLIISAIGDAQRQLFGDFSANLLFYAEAGATAVVLTTALLWRKGKHNLSISLGLFGLSFALSFLGWFVHPDQIYSRALERLTDWENSFDRYKFDQSNGAQYPDAGVTYQRFATELAARRCEYEAAEIRYRGDPAFFRSSFQTWTLWGFAVCCAVFSAVVIFIAYQKRKVDVGPQGLS